MAVIPSRHHSANDLQLAPATMHRARLKAHRIAAICATSTTEPSPAFTSTNSLLPRPARQLLRNPYIEYTFIRTHRRLPAPAQRQQEPNEHNAKQQYDDLIHDEASGMRTGTPSALPTPCRPLSRSGCLSADRAIRMSSTSANKNKPFLTILILAFALGLAVAVVLCAIWRYHPQVFNTQMRVAAIVVCPAFLLAGVLEATVDNTLALIITVGTIIFSNGFLYAGLASFIYFLMTVFLRKPQS
jgi:hypothetical protein